MVNADGSSKGTFGVRLRKAEGSPVTPLILVIGPEVHLIRVVVGVDLVELLIVVALAVDEGKKEISRLGAKNFFEDAGFQVVLYFVAGCILAVLENASIATAGGRRARFFNFVVSRIREAQHQSLELLAKFVFLGQILEAFAFCFRRRVQNEMALANKDSAGHFAIDGGNKTDRA